MPTNYPAALDAFVNPSAAGGDTLDDPPHDDQHTDANDAIEAIETELGINPRGAEATVRARLDAVEAAASDLPQGVLDYAEVTATQSGVGTSDTDLTGLSVTVDLPASRRIRVTVAAAVNSPSTNMVPRGKIKEGTTALQDWVWGEIASGARTRSEHSVILTPSAGSHTYKATLSTNTGTIAMFADGERPAFIMVEDLGAA